MSVASVTASFPSRNGRARNGESSASACENFTFHGQTDWEMCRYTRFKIALATGQGTCGPGAWTGGRQPVAFVDFPRGTFKIHEL